MDGKKENLVRLISELTFNSLFFQTDDDLAFTETDFKRIRDGIRKIHDEIHDPSPKTDSEQASHFDPVVRERKITKKEALCSIQ